MGRRVLALLATLAASSPAPAAPRPREAAPRPPAAEARPHDVGAHVVSAREDVLAFQEDTAGRYQYTLRFRDIATGRDHPERIPGLSGAIAWANDNQTVFYVENDPVTLLSTRVKKHVLGTDPATDPVVYEEKDTSFYLGVDKSGDHRYVMLRLSSTVASEQWVEEYAFILDRLGLSE